MLGIQTATSGVPTWRCSRGRGLVVEERSRNADARALQAIGFEEATDEPFAMSAAIGERGVDKVPAQFLVAMERRE